MNEGMNQPDQPARELKPSEALELSIASTLSSSKGQLKVLLSALKKDAPNALHPSMMELLENVIKGLEEGSKNFEALTKGK